MGATTGKLNLTYPLQIDVIYRTFQTDFLSLTQIAQTGNQGGRKQAVARLVPLPGRMLPYGSLNRIKHQS